MLYLLLAVLCSGTLANVLHLYAKRRLRILQVFAGNYVMACLFSLGLNGKLPTSINLFDLGLSAFAGLMFLGTFIIYQRNLHINGLSLTVGAMRFSLIIPLLFSLLWLNEQIFLPQYAGIALVLLSFAVLTKGGTLHSLMWLFVLTIATGITDTALKVFTSYGSCNINSFMIMLFGFATVINWLLIAIRKQKIHWPSVAAGLLLGLPNMLTTRFFLVSLNMVKASVAYPVFAAGVVLAGLLSDMIFWKKQFTRLQKLAFLAMLVGIVFLNAQY